MNNIIFASVISEIQQSPMFMTVQAVICDTPEANLNGARVTEAFVNEVIKNKKRYVGLPLYADVKALTNGSYNRLGHLYDVKTGEFHSTQIGSFYDFEKVEFDKGYHLVGYARIPKRNKKLSKAITELFSEGRLKFSFEVAVGEYDENDDGTITIDASEHNYLEGTAIVTYPACEDAVALQLVAQKTDDQERGEQNMEKNLTAEQQVTQEETPAETSVETPVVAETPAEETPVETAESPVETTEPETVQTEETSTAEVYVTETVTEAREVHAFDTETGKAFHQEAVVRTTTSDEIEGTLVETQDGIHVAEETKETAESGDNSGVVTAAGDDADSETTPDPENTTKTLGEGTDGQDLEDPSEETPEETIEDPATDATESKRKTAEQLIAELAEVVENLRKEVAELKEKTVVAEKKSVTAEINPMMGDINTQKKYGLLEKDYARHDSYSLLNKY